MFKKKKGGGRKKSLHTVRITYLSSWGVSRGQTQPCQRLKLAGKSRQSWVTVSASSSSSSSPALPLSPWVSGASEAGISRRDAETGSCLSASLWRMTKPLAALGASCVLQLQMSSPGSILDAVWARAEAGRVDPAGVSCTIYTSIREGGDTRSKKHPHQDPPFISSFTFFLSFSLLHY